MSHASKTKTLSVCVCVCVLDCVRIVLFCTALKYSFWIENATNKPKTQNDKWLTERKSYPSKNTFGRKELNKSEGKTANHLKPVIGPTAQL